MQGYILVCAARFHTPLAFLRPIFILRIGLNPFLQGPLPHYPITLLLHYLITPLPSLSKVPHPMTFRHWRTWLLKAIQGQVNLLFTLKKYLDGGRGWILPSVQEREEKKILYTRREESVHSLMVGIIWESLEKGIRSKPMKRQLNPLHISLKS